MELHFVSKVCLRCKHCIEDKIERGLSCFYCEEEMDNFETEEGCWQYNEREDDDEHSD